MYENENGKVDSLEGWMLPKIRIIYKEVNGRICLPPNRNGAGGTKD